MSEQPAPAPPGRLLTGVSYALVIVLAVLLAVWGAFLVPTRISGVAVPVGWAVAVVGNVGLGWVGGRLLGRPGAVGVAVVWLALALTFASPRAEGDLIVPGTVPGLGFLLLGAVSCALAYGAAPRHPPAN